MGGWIGTALFAAGLVLSAPVAAQTTLEVAPPIVTIDRDRLFAETDFGKSVQAEIENRAATLGAENRRIETDLIAEEQSLTTARETLSPEEFRVLADAFDQKVQQLRSEQDTKSREVQRFSEEAQQRFLELIIPVLGELLRERGALIVMDRRDVFLSAGSIDITEEAIARIDERLGEAGNGQDEGDGTNP